MRGLFSRLRSKALCALLMLVVAGCNKSQGQSGDKQPLVLNKELASPSAATPPTPTKAPDRGPERTVFSLVDNRLLAHPQSGGGLLINVGSAGFAKYMRFGRSAKNWLLRQKKDGKAVARPTGKTGRLLVPLAPHQVEGEVTIRLRVHSNPQRLGFRINGHRKGELTLQIRTAGWSTLKAVVPAGMLRPGENEVLLFASKYPPVIDWLQVGGTPARASPVIYDRSQKALRLPREGGLAYYLSVPEKGRLVGDVNGSLCEVKVVATDSDGNRASGSLVGVGSAVDLGAVSGRAVRLELVAQGCQQVFLKSAALVVPGRDNPRKKGPAPEHIALLILDSLRADRLKPIHNQARAEVPTLSGLVGKAAFFQNAYVQGNESKASHASLWTSMYPVAHKMIVGRRNNPSNINKKWLTIDEVTKRGGFFNSGVSANGYIRPKRGFGTQWDVYYNHIHDGGGLKAENLLTRLWTTLAGKEREKWFAYIGFIDTHVSWRGKQPWLAKYADASYRGRFKKVATGKDIGAVATGKLRISEADKKQISALYDSNVSYQDQQLGLFLDKLRELGIADKTLLIITSDHGDELFEHGRVGHGASLKETLVHVPLIFYYPPLFPAGAYSEGAEVIDIVPTIADALGMEMNEHWQGESLLPIVAGVRASYPLLAFSSKYEEVHVGRMGRWKLRAPGVSQGQLFDVKVDPFERSNVAKKRPVERRMLADALWLLRAYNKQWRKWKWGNAANHRPAFAAEMGE